MHAGATPVFVDIEPRTYNMDVSEIEYRDHRADAGDSASGGQIGLAADIPAVVAIAGSAGLVVVEDAAPALGATVGEVRIGSAFRFHLLQLSPAQSITTGEGGMILTNDEPAAVRLRALRSHAASSSDLSRHQSGTTVIEEYPEVGFNYRMTDILREAVGCVQMGRLDNILAARAILAERYNALLADVPGDATVRARGAL